jgi:hypothetical protein
MAAVLKLYFYNFINFFLFIQYNFILYRNDLEDVKDVEEDFLLFLIDANIRKVDICKKLDVLLVERVSRFVVKLWMKSNDKKNRGHTFWCPL